MMQNAGRESAPAKGNTRTENKDEEHQKATTAIYDITDACFNTLERLVLSAKANSSLEQALVSDSPSSDESPRDIRGLRNSFAFWVDYTGALAPVGASLDDRLHSHDDIQEMVVELLEMVEKNLCRLERNRDEKDSQHWLSAIDSALDRLHFLASAIRQASARGFEQDLLNFVSDEDKLFHGMAISYVKWKCPKARPSLREHMGDTIAGRRRALLLKHRHAKKLKTRRALKQSPTLNPEHPLPPSVEKATAKLTALGGISHVLPSTAGSRATQASKMDGRAALQYINQRPTLSIRSSGSSQQGDSLSAEYPDPPRIQPGEKHVQCPYCLQPLPSAEMRMATKNEYWRRHVNQDLQPYVCLFRRCTNSLFSHQSDWRKHMATAHSKEWPREVHSMTWYCDLGHKEPFEFDNETDWREHMRTLSLHPGRSKPPSDTQLDTLAVRKQQLSPREPHVCPFCEDKPQSIAVLGDRGNPTDTVNILVDHIAKHVKSLSFLSLPGLEDEANEDDRMSANLENLSHKRLRNPGSPPQPPSGVTFVEDISLMFKDNDDEPKSQVHKKPPPVIQIDPEYVTEQSAYDMNDTAENEVDRFFTSIPAIETDFSWDFIPRHDVPLSAIDSAFKQWPNHASTSAPQTEAQQDPHWIVPLARNKDFVGRKAILAQLLERIPPSADLDDCQRTAIQGLGGVGKTQIALESAFRVRERYPDCSVFWVPAVDAASFENAYRVIGRQLKVEGIDEDNADVESLVKTTLSRENAGSWLLIIDDADDVEIFLPSLVRDLPFSRNGSILIITRNQKAAVKLTGTNFIKVPPMDQLEALELLRTNLARDYTLSDVETLLELVDLLAYLPLVIRQASAYINENQISIAEFLEMYKSGEDEMIELLSHHFEDYSRYGKVQNSLTSAWFFSFHQILRRNPLAADYLRFMSFLAQHDIPQSLLPPHRRVETIEALGTLKGYSFITERAESKSYDIHRLVQLVVRNWLKERGEWNEWATKVLQRLAEAFPFPTHKNKDVWMNYLPHTRYILTLHDDYEGDKTTESNLLFNVGESFLVLGKYQEAEQIHWQALELRERLLGKEHPDTLDSMNSLAVVLHNRGKYQEAEEIHQQTLALRKKMLGSEHPLTLNSINNLALVFNDQGRYEEAEQTYWQLLKLENKILGKEHPDTLASTSNLAVILSNQGKYMEAEQIEREILELRKRVLGTEHPDTLHSMKNLAEVFRNQGKLEEAEHLQRQALGAYERVLGSEHPDTLHSMKNLAKILQDQGKLEEAEHLQRQALEAYERVLGSEHPDTLHSIKNLAKVLQDQGKLKEAEHLQRQALKAYKRVPRAPFTRPHASFDRFMDDFTQSLKRTFPTNQKSYDNVHVLLICWAEDDLGTEKEIDDLDRVFCEAYNYTTERGFIPSENSYNVLEHRIMSFRQSHDSSSNLLILYYGGHAVKEEFGSKSIWAAKHGPHSPLVDWSEIQPALLRSQADVLLLLDCNYASSVGTRGFSHGAKEVLAACSMEDVTTGVHDNSFTRILIEELRHCAKKGVTTWELNGRLMARRSRDELSFTPRHFPLQDSAAAGIELRPLASSSDLPLEHDPQGFKGESSIELATPALSESASTLLTEDEAMLRKDAPENIELVNARFQSSTRRRGIDRTTDVRNPRTWAESVPNAEEPGRKSRVEKVLIQSEGAFDSH